MAEEISFSTLGYTVSEDVEAEFSNGKRIIPAWQVLHLGGPEKFKSSSLFAQLKNQTFEQFQAVFYKRVTQAMLDGWQTEKSGFPKSEYLKKKEGQI